MYEAKRGLIEESGFSIFRFHDYWHRHEPDGILTGMTSARGWSEYQAGPNAKRFDIPECSFEALIRDVKANLGISAVRAAGAPDMPCNSVVLLAGSTPGQVQIQALMEGADVVMCGESNEWDTCEYVRDAAAVGQRDSSCSATAIRRMAECATWRTGSGIALEMAF